MEQVAFTDQLLGRLRLQGVLMNKQKINQGLNAAFMLLLYFRDYQRLSQKSHEIIFCH